MFADNSIKAVQHYFLDKLQDAFSKREIELFTNYCLEFRFSLKRSDVILNSRRFSESELLWFRSVVKRLLQNEPIQYILGKVFFYGKEYQVTSDVLIPRPETEELVDLIIKDMPTGLLVDIGTGSGVIPISIKSSCPAITATAVDVSEKAVSIARINANQHSCEVQFIILDILQSDLPEMAYDVIVSNPPYVLESDKTDMKANVLLYEPDIALFVPDQTPLVFYERIIQLADKLKVGGRLYFEIHENFGQEILSMITAAKFNSAIIIKDLQGKDRFIKAVK